MENIDFSQVFVGFSDLHFFPWPRTQTRCARAFRRFPPWGSVCITPVPSSCLEPSSSLLLFEGTTFEGLQGEAQRKSGFPKGFPWCWACGFLLVTSRKPTERTQGTDTTAATSKGPCQTTLPRWEPQLKIIAMCKGDTPCRNSGRGVDHQSRHCPKLSGASSSPTNPRNPVATKPETGRIRHQPFVLESSHSCDEM